MESGLTSNAMAEVELGDIPNIGVLITLPFWLISIPVWIICSDRLRRRKAEQRAEQERKQFEERRQQDYEELEVEVLKTGRLSIRDSFSLERLQTFSAALVDHQLDKLKDHPAGSARKERILELRARYHPHGAANQGLARILTELTKTIVDETNDLIEEDNIAAEGFMDVGPADI